MAGLPRESAFMPTIKCSQCSNEVEISMMGEHLCGGAAKYEEIPPVPIPEAGIGATFASLKNNLFGFGSKSTPLSKVDIAAANEAFKQEQLTPASNYTGARSLSPRTPTERPSFGTNGDGYISPKIADASSPARERVGGYGGFGDPQNSDGDTAFDGERSPKPPNLLQRLNSVTPGPFEARRKPHAKNAFAPQHGRSGSSSSTSNAPEALDPPSWLLQQQQNNTDISNPYRRPSRPPDDSVTQPFDSAQLAKPISKQLTPDSYEPPARRPSGSGYRSEYPPDPASDMDRPRTREGRDQTRKMSQSFRDTSRPPPPRTSLIRPTTMRRDSSLAINLAEEFGSSNPYHASSISSISQSSSNSGYSMLSELSRTSTNATSPARSTDESNSSETSNIDQTTTSFQMSPTNLKSEPPPTSNEVRFPPRSSSRFPSRDIRDDPAIQNGGWSAPRARSPAFSPRAETFPRNQETNRYGEHGRPHVPLGHRRGPSTGRSRGDCKACKAPITGKSIASADGRLTGRYHKACFVCTTCLEPFPSSTFYVLDDQPYCERHYHRLNGSLCGTCNSGIEGEYLEDERIQKHHPSCFRCGDCGRVLQDGYFEVNGKAYCERDAWRRVKPPPLPPGASGRGVRPLPYGQAYGLPSGNRPGAAVPRSKMEKRMTRTGMI